MDNIDVQSDKLFMPAINYTQCTATTTTTTNIIASLHILIAFPLYRKVAKRLVSILPQYVSICTKPFILIDNIIRLSKIS